MRTAYVASDAAQRNTTVTRAQAVTMRAGMSISQNRTRTNYTSQGGI